MRRNFLGIARRNSPGRVRAGVVGPSLGLRNYRKKNGTVHVKSLTLKFLGTKSRDEKKGFILGLTDSGFCESLFRKIVNVLRTT